MAAGAGVCPAARVIPGDGRVAAWLGLAEPVRGLFVAAALGRVRAAEVLAVVRGSGPG